MVSDDGVRNIYLSESNEIRSKNIHDIKIKFPRKIFPISRYNNLKTFFQ